jgi:hypothetical protein
MGALQEARARGITWAEEAHANMSSDVAWPSDTRILVRLAAMDVADLAGDHGELVLAWIAAAGERWRESRVVTEGLRAVG